MMRISSLCTAALYPAYVSVHWYSTYGEVGRGSCQLLLISASSRVTCLLHDTAPLFANTVSLSKHVTDLGGYNGLYAPNKSLVLCLVIQPKTLMQFLECCEHFAHPLYGCSNMLIHHAVPQTSSSSWQKYQSWASGNCPFQCLGWHIFRDFILSSPAPTTFSVRLHFHCHNFSLTYILFHTLL